MKKVEQILTRDGKLKDVIVDIKWKMVTIYEVRIDGKLFEDTENKERADQLKDVLPKFYPNSTITVTAKKKRKYTERRYG